MSAQCAHSTRNSGSNSGSRRRKLWELDHKHHCQVIGVCFDVGSLRRLIRRAIAVPSLITDYELHRCTVQACEQRGRVSELLHKTLEKRYHLRVNHLKGADEALLLTTWNEALQRGDVGPTLWAVLTHPRCSEGLEAHVYGTLHMLQHQMGTEQRSEQIAYQSLRQEHAALLRAHADAQLRATQARDERIQEAQVLRNSLMQTQAEKIALQTRVRHLEEQCDQLSRQLPDLADRERLTRRAHEAEAMCQALRMHARGLEEAREYWEARCQRLLAATPPKLEDTEHRNHKPEKPVDLQGKQVLCIGGRPHVIGFYRQLVEGRGGRFAHHDGGLEENLAALEPSIAASDAVICQAGCINHNAYGRVKDFCKRTGKPCIFVKSNGLSSFERGLEKLAIEEH